MKLDLGEIVGLGILGVIALGLLAIPIAAILSRNCCC